MLLNNERQQTHNMINLQYMDQRTYNIINEQSIDQQTYCDWVMLLVECQNDNWLKCVILSSINIYRFIYLGMTLKPLQQPCNILVRWTTSSIRQAYKNDIF